MRPRRIYLPLTIDQLRALAADKVLPAPIAGFAPGASDTRLGASAGAVEEAEFRAFSAAVESADQPDSPLVRLIIASADAPAGAWREVGDEAGGPVAIVTTEDLPLRLIVAFHIDGDTDADGAGGADGDAADRITAADLLWYDVTELDVVIDELG